MKYLFILFLPIVFSFNPLFACSIEPLPLRKEFRQSQNVFTGEIIEISNIPNNPSKAKEEQKFGIVKFKIFKTWKGGKDSEISLFSNVGSSLCGNDFDYFKKGEKYLIFAGKDYVDFLSATKLSNAQEKINRLDNFGFRLWSRIYPF